MVMLILLNFMISLSPAKIADRMDAVKRGQDFKAQLDILIEKPGGSKKSRVVDFLRRTEDREDKILFDFQTPRDVKGTKLLSWSDSKKESDFWIFLPALKRTRRLSGSSRHDKFLGTGFTYEDLTRRSPSKDRFKGGQKVSCGKHKCYVIEAYPKDDLPYEKRKIWVRMDNFIPVKIEYYDKDGSLAKVQKNSSITKVQNFWTVRVSSMEEKKEKRVTTFKFSGVKYNSSLSPRLFVVSSLN